MHLETKGTGVGNVCCKNETWIWRNRRHCEEARKKRRKNDTRTIDSKGQKYITKGGYK
jgi:hypothetical protein